MVLNLHVDIEKYRMVFCIFITGEKTKDEIIQGFEIGCDDYVTKPFVPLLN